VKRHEADAVSLVFGLIFVGLAAGWALSRANLVDFADLQFAGPILLIAAGAIGLIVSLRRGRQAQVAEPAERSGYAGDTVVMDQPGEGTSTERTQDLSYRRSDGPADDRPPGS
jgi:hypothetical protein